MKKILLGLCLVLSNIVYANTTQINTTQSLTREQEAQLQAEAAKMVADSMTNPTTPTTPGQTAQTVRSWVEVGSAIGSGLAASAKELGMAANQFATTPVGKVTVFLIVWHFFGAQAIHILFGLLWITVGTILWVYFYRKLIVKTTITFFEPGKGPNGATKQVVRTPTDMSMDENQVMVTVYVVLLIVMLLIGVIGIFSY